jgi:hypothetical protein
VIFGNPMKKISKKVDYSHFLQLIFLFFAIFDNLKIKEIQFFQSENSIFGSFKLFLSAKIDFWPF